MTSIQHHVVTQSHASSNQLDSHLDALLDDLQTSVSRPGASMALTTQNGPLLNGSAFGGQITLPPGATGYREVTTTVTRENNGVPTTSRDYQIEYLNPANSITVLDERSSSPALDMLRSGGDLSGQHVKSFKTEVYDYKFSKTTTDRKTSGYGTAQVGVGEEGKAVTMDRMSYYPNEPPKSESALFSRTENFKRETNVSKNLNELDMLLKELNNNPSTGPGDSMVSSKREHIQAIDIGKSSGGYNESSTPSTIPRRSASATREASFSERTETRSNKGQSPMVTPKTGGKTIQVQREYNTMESRSHTSRRDSPSTPTLRRRTPSPSSGEFRPSNFSSYPISPKDLTPTRTVMTKTYNYSSTGRRTPTPTAFADEPQPYRSPSPVSFPQKRSPSPVRKNLNRTDSGRSVSYQVSPPVSENPTIITYKYSSHSREQSRYPGSDYDERDKEEAITQPFPTSTPVSVVGDQSPPKKLDELMASFQDSKSRAGKEYHQGSNEYRHHVEYSRESHERHGGDLQRSPSFERNLRPSSVKVTQTYSTQNQQSEDYQNQNQHKEQYQHREQYEQREQPSSYHREYQRREEYQMREHPSGQQQKNQYQQQQSQYQQYHRSQGGYQHEQREQFQKSRGQSQHSQQYQYQQHQQYQQNSLQMPTNESISPSSYAHRGGSASRSVVGPPVYYPPGVELFTKKEEAMLMQEQGSGKDRSKGKPKSKYEKSDKGKDRGKKMSGVPVCLPVCCAAPCSIM